MPDSMDRDGPVCFLRGKAGQSPGISPFFPVFSSTDVFLSFLQLPAAPGTVFKTLFRLIAAGRTVPAPFLTGPAPSGTAAGAAAPSDQSHLLRPDFRLFSSLQPPASLRIKLIKALTAGSLRIIFSSPSEHGNKEQAQAHAGHIDLISSVSSAAAADHRSKASYFLPV